jgi:integrase
MTSFPPCKLTDQFIRSRPAAAPGDRDRYPDERLTGFDAIVTDQGHRSWRVNYTWPGTKSPAPYTIGNAAVIPHAKALEMAREALCIAVTEKRDPRPHKTKKAVQVVVPTIAQGITEYMMNGRRNKKGTGPAKDIKMADAKLRKELKEWLEQPVTVLAGEGGETICRGIISRLAHVLKENAGANQAHSYINSLCHYFKLRGYIKTNPMREVERMGKSIKREVVLNEHQIGRVLRANAALRATYPVASGAVDWLWYTMGRRSEVSGVLLVDIKNDLVTFRATKNGRDHAVPLIPAMVGALPPRGSSPFAFAGTTSGKPFNSWSRYKLALDAAIAADGDEGPMPEWCWHDIRRTGTTQWREMGFDRALVSQQLNHSFSDSTSNYDHSTVLGARRRAMEAWAARLEALTTNSPSPDNVVPLHA